MKTKRNVSVLAALVVAAAAAFLPRAAQATEEPLRVWGISNLGETCTGKCGVRNICCKIVVVGPSPIAENVEG